MRKSITSETLIHFVDEYTFDFPGKKIKIPALGDYIRKKGFPNVQNYTIRRNKECVDYISSLNNKTEENVRNDLVTYKTIDVDAFIAANSSPAALKKALIEKDSYYARIANNAVIVIDENKSLKKEKEELQKKNIELIAEIERLKEKKADSIPVKTLKKILKDYVYPEFANAILDKEGILKAEASMVPNETLDANLIDANTELTPKIIEESEFDAIKSLMNEIKQG